MRFWVLALDQRGHGESAWAADYSFEAMRDDVVGFADALGLNRFSLIGHSMGGTVAYLTAATILGRVDRLVIEDTAPPWPGAPLPGKPDRPGASVSYDWAAVESYFAQVGAPNPAWWAALPAITARTLIIGGGTTSPVPQYVLADVARRIEGAQLQTIQGAGHHVHSTKPVEFLSAVQLFLG